MTTGNDNAASIVDRADADATTTPELNHSTFNGSEWRTHLFKLGRDISIELKTNGAMTLRLMDSEDEELEIGSLEAMLLLLILDQLNPAQALDLAGMSISLQGVNDIVSFLVDSGILDPILPRPSAQAPLLRDPFVHFRSVGVMDQPSWRSAVTRYIRPQIPILMDGLLRDWPAMDLWTPRYLDRLLSVDRDSQRNPGTFWRLLDIDSANANLIGARLVGHVRFPFERPTRGPFRFHYGPAGAIDVQRAIHHNFLANVLGTLRVVVFPLESTSQPISSMDEKFVLSRQAHAFAATIGPGQTLFIPSRWCCYMTALTESASLSFFWETLSIMHYTRLLEPVRQIGLILRRSW